MKLDQTFIAIRERGITEICDLSLHVFRDHFKPLISLLLVGCLPWIILDWVVVGWLLGADVGEEFRGFFYLLMALLVVSQSQVGTAFMTYYLGQAMFVGQPGVRESIKGTLKTTPYFLMSHGIGRLVIPILIGAIMIPRNESDGVAWMALGLVPLMLLFALLVRGFRPFVSEMMLLERTPLRSDDSNKVNFSRRSKFLHSPVGSDLFGRLIVTSLFFAPLSCAIYFLFIACDATLNLQVNSEFSLFPYYWTVALWLTAGFATVVRFLSYVDIRIRQEGWSVELRMRAEGARVAQAIE